MCLCKLGLGQREEWSWGQQRLCWLGEGSYPGLSSKTLGLGKACFPQLWHPTLVKPLCMEQPYQFQPGNRAPRRPLLWGFVLGLKFDVVTPLSAQSSQGSARAQSRNIPLAPQRSVLRLKLSFI